MRLAADGMKAEGERVETADARDIFLLPEKKKELAQNR